MAAGDARPVRVSSPVFRALTAYLPAMATALTSPFPHPVGLNVRPMLAPVSLVYTDTASSNANVDSRHDEVVVPDFDARIHDATSTQSVTFSTPLMAM